VDVTNIAAVNEAAEDDGPMAPEQAAILLRNWRRMRPWVVLVIAGLAALQYFVIGIDLAYVLLFFMAVTAWTLWYLPRSIGKISRGDFR
jgi:hypothetical protein